MELLIQLRRNEKTDKVMIFMGDLENFMIMKATGKLGYKSFCSQEEQAAEKSQQLLKNVPKPCETNFLANPARKKLLELHKKLIKYLKTGGGEIVKRRREPGKNNKRNIRIAKEI